MKKYLATITLHIFCLTILSLCFKSISGTTEITMDKPKDIIIFNTKNVIIPKKKDYEELHEDYEQMKKDKAFELAEKYKKKKGDCFKIAVAFIKELKGLNDCEKVEIKESEVEIGDLVFYKNNGYGMTHWSVVLDLENNVALHGSGNFNRETLIRKVYEPNMAKPKFYRLVERTK